MGSSLDAARASWFPAINATAGATRSASSAATAASGNAPPRNSFSLGATVSWELEAMQRCHKEGGDWRALAEQRLPARSVAFDEHLSKLG